ncbi:Dps family protein [Mesoterricola sediminis]|uniref:DNA starvation/stationary phase protection protein n=1 Tax=Mesoterricola sediminis TaxID=2927980 RepID=A0AA48GXW5_9BACT|nr:DNA starvation/stationary phase protection protein [Mesoterricola sediminis]BDU76037.1 DNA starvation/stationary phase protection protein [Mesoterricola sediminis]
MNPAVIDLLNVQLASAQMLLLNAKRYHWTVSGPNFRDYHLRFEELYQAVLPMVDELGERVRALDGIPVTTPQQITAASVVPASDPSRPLKAQEMVAEALASVEAVVAAQASGIDVATAAGDAGTADLLTGFIQVFQKEAWFLRAMRG